MSFRKRNDQLLAGARPVPSLGRPVPGVIARTPALAKLPNIRGPNASNQPSQPSALNVPFVKPSTITSQPTISTGCADLDKVILHSGLPLGTSLLVEETGTTDYASVLLRAFASQGVVQNRLKGFEKQSHVILLGATHTWAAELPGIYKGTLKEQKHKRIASDSSKVSVSNMAENSMKIAWRYGLNEKSSPPPDQSPSDEQYITQFDITLRLMPGAGAADFSTVELAPTPAATIRSLEKALAAHKQKVVRIVCPGFLGPALYSPQYCAPSYSLPLIHGMSSLLRKHSNATAVISLSLDLYPRECLLTKVMELVLDGVVHLEPFSSEMAAFIERAYKSEPLRIQQGLVHIVKVPVLSERGHMETRNAEYAFKNGRKNFEIEEWGIPVDDEDDKDSKSTVDF